MRKVFVDILVVALSVLLAVYLGQSGITHTLVSATSGSTLVASAVAGVFFTSIFTVAPATVVLGELSQQSNLFIVSLAGALGAMMGDYLMFLLVRQRLAPDAAALA